MILLAELVVFIISTVILAQSSYIVVKSSVRIARITRLGELVVGFLFLSFVTSLPELIVSMNAIITEDVGISVGNALGSNVTNIGLIIGLVALMRPVKITEATLNRLSIILSLSSLILFFLLSMTTLSRVVGLALLFAFLIFSLYSVRERIIFGRISKEKSLQLFKKIKLTIGFYKSLFLLLLSLAVVIVSSRFVVDSASNIASMLGIAKSIIGATIIALGTSLPELSTTLAAVKEGHLKLGLGNTIGSCLTNLTLVLGLVLLASPFSVDMEVFTTLVMFTFVSTVLLWVFLGSLGRRKLEKTEGMVLLIFYVIFLVLMYSGSI
jgi:cation:H+ antiporter